MQEARTSSSRFTFWSRRRRTEADHVSHSTIPSPPHSTLPIRLHRLQRQYFALSLLFLFRSTVGEGQKQESKRAGDRQQHQQPDMPAARSSGKSLSTGSQIKKPGFWPVFWQINRLQLQKNR